ncbi:hypothetical protein H0H92_007290 [Tricholoma furcatifolium]|nr:hypothetical protein H0H92_007290 [Tricholoma furcatifolium]
MDLPSSPPETCMPLNHPPPAPTKPAPPAPTPSCASASTSTRRSQNTPGSCISNAPLHSTNTFVR